MSGIPVWYIPSWHGDLRLEAVARGVTRIELHDPTPSEREVAGLILEKAREKGWVPPGTVPTHFQDGNDVALITAPLGEVGPLASSIARPSEGVLTAITFMSGRVIAVENARADLGAVIKRIETETRATMERVAEEEARLKAAWAAEVKAKAAAEPTERATALADVTPKAAVTVRRPTPCCPQCTPGAVGPASEVLLTFLDQQQHKDWSERRAIVVRGGITGYRYLLAHRETELAARIGRICFDVDSRCVVHFHDRTVPPEEEVLAAKLILEHREPWLRNEATVFGVGRRSRVFKNPFGNMMDGVQDAVFTERIGQLFDAESLDRSLSGALCRAIQTLGADS